MKPEDINKGSIQYRIGPVTTTYSTIKIGSGLEGYTYHVNSDLSPDDTAAYNISLESWTHVNNCDIRLNHTFGSLNTKFPHDLNNIKILGFVFAAEQTVLDTIKNGGQFPYHNNDMDRDDVISIFYDAYDFIKNQNLEVERETIIDLILCCVSMLPFRGRFIMDNPSDVYPYKFSWSDKDELTVEYEPCNHYLDLIDELRDKDWSFVEESKEWDLKWKINTYSNRCDRDFFDDRIKDYEVEFSTPDLVLTNGYLDITIDSNFRTRREGFIFYVKLHKMNEELYVRDENSNTKSEITTFFRRGQIKTEDLVENIKELIEIINKGYKNTLEKFQANIKSLENLQCQID